MTEHGGQSTHWSNPCPSATSRSRDTGYMGPAPTLSGGDADVRDNNSVELDDDMDLRVLCGGHENTEWFFF